VPGFDLLAALDACAGHLVRHGGHRAAAGLEVARDALEAFRASFAAHADAALTEELRTPVERVDAVVAGDELGLALAEELAMLAPFGNANPDVSLLVPAARLTDVRPMGEGRHVRFTVEAGGVRARAVGFGTAGWLPCAADGPVDATFTLELDDWGGTVEPRLVLRHARPAAPPPIRVVGEGPFLARALAAAAEPPAPWPPTPGSGSGAVAPCRDRRGGGIAGVLAALVASGEPVLAVCADVPRRLPGLAERLGGFALTSHAALERDPGLARGYAHLVVLDPPPYATVAAAPGPLVHLAHGVPELDFSVSIHELEHELRAPLTALYRALRATGGAEGEALEAALRGDGRRSPEGAGRALRVLVELGLADLDPGRCRVSVPAAQGTTSLERSATYRAIQQRLEDGRKGFATWHPPRASTGRAAA
jgi:single-stranded-DNA-specific exonuclease